MHHTKITPTANIVPNNRSVAGKMPGEQQMSESVYYHQGCPVCGRMLRIGVRLLGQRVYCQHCGGGFRASDSGQGNASPDLQTDRVEQLLARAAASLSEARLPEKCEPWADPAECGDPA